MKTISLTQGKVVLVDDADYERLNKWKWYALRNHCTFYAARGIRSNKGKRRTELMHRVILGLQPDDKRECDHIDGDGLNNQQSNLRICTIVQNHQNQRNLRISISKYKGVSWHRCNSKWQSLIRVDKKRIHLGYFNLETDAAHAYDQAAIKHFGKFALTNKMLGLL